MFNANIVTLQDLKELKKLEKARQFDEERKARIFNARQRLIGVDIEALQKQIQEKKARDEAQQNDMKSLYLKERHDIEVVDALHQQIDRNKKILHDQINEFRRTYQRKQDRREFDLNDPDALKKSLPCRLGDDDPRISISSVQKFEGEDGVAKERAKIKKEQQKTWLFQQISEKRLIDSQKKETDKIQLEIIKARDERAKMLDKLEKQTRKEIELANVAYNKALANEQAIERRLRQEMELENNKAEINNALTSDLLTENTDVAQSNLGVGKIIGSMYRGMSREEKDEILKTQAAQREELAAKREAEKVREKYWEEYADKINESVYFMDLRNSQKQKEDLRKLYEENERLSQEQKAQKEYMNKIVFSNKPTAEFYNQFNKSTR